jgi:phosphoglycerate dehydrogenase-like enzyme
VSRIVVDLRDRRPVWALPEWAVRELEQALPPGWELHAASSFADGAGDGVGGPAPEVLEVLRGARVYMGYGIRPQVLEAGGDSLEWVHTGTAGVGGSLHAAMRESSVRFTNSAGVHGPPIAETVVAMLLHFARGLDFAARAQGEGKWDDAPFLAADTPVREISAMTVGILGYGGIGREVGRRVRALGAKVLGLKRSPPAEKAGAAPQEMGDPPRDAHGVELFHGAAGLDRLLAESDALVVSAPSTPATRGIVSRERIRALRKGAVVVNVARGSLVDEDALVEALRDGHLRGAALDVFDQEPLPADHPLWRLPNVLITPHVSGVTRGFWRREMDLIVENLRRFVAGEPLLNEVDRDAGY